MEPLSLQASIWPYLSADDRARNTGL